MTLSEISIRKPVFAWMLMIGLMLFGALSFRELGVSQMPDVDFPVVSISVNLIGAAPEVMETQVVDVIEDAVMEIEGIRSVTSNSRQGSANIAVEFELGSNIDVAVQELQNHISHVKSNLPAELDPPAIRKQNPEDQPILWLALVSDSDIKRDVLMRYARNVLFDRFSTIDGVGDIALGGYVDTNLRIWISSKKLDRYDLTVSDVISSIRAQQIDLPAGRMENAKQEMNVRLMGEATDLENIGRIMVSTRGGGANYRPVPLASVARIEEGLADVRRISRADGKVAVGLGIMKQHGSNAVDVADRVKAKVSEIEKTLPSGYHILVRNDSTRFIKQAVGELTSTLILSAIATSLVCFLFLGSLSSTANVLLAIPTSIIGAFIFLRLFHFTLNTFTLLGLSLAIGIVVDDAIMMLENIVRHREMGKTRKNAAIDGSREVTFAAIAATVAVVAIFLPVIFAKGIVGAFLFHFGITVTAAVLLSLLEALTLTPMRCAHFLSAGATANKMQRLLDRMISSLERRYHIVLSLTLKRPIITLLVSIAVLVPGFLIAGKLGGELTPAQDQAMFMVRIKTPVGSSLNHTDTKFKTVENYVRAMPEVSGIFTAIGGFGGDAVNEAMAFVSLVDANSRKATQTDIMDRVRKELPKQLGKGIKLIVQDLSLRGFGSGRGFPIEVNVVGPDWERLGVLVNDLMAKMAESGVLTDVNSDYQIGMPEIQIHPDRTKAVARGINMTQMAQTVNTLIGGTALGATTKYPKDGHKYDIRVRLEGNERLSSEDLKHIKMRNNRGELVPLGDIMAIEEKPTPQVITRIDRERAVKLYANVAPGHTQKEGLSLLSEIASKTLPSGYSIKVSGSAQAFQETFRSLVFALGLGIAVSYMVLASQFNSFIHPISVLMAMPSSLSGAFVALWLGHQSINMFSMIGLILLMGIVKKNSILLVDFTNQVRLRDGRSVNESLLTACPVRLRPILMTSLATIAGAIPAALAIGPGAETRIPMAIAIIGGVIVSTVLTLVVVPCAYTVLSRFERRVI